MDTKKNYTEVLIDGKVYVLGGNEETGYLQKIASYVNHKLKELRSQAGFSKQEEDYQQLMLEINMADDYFKAQETADALRQQKEEIERDIYGLKHDLINTQIKLEKAQQKIEELESALSAAVNLANNTSTVSSSESQPAVHQEKNDPYILTGAASIPDGRSTITIQDMDDEADEAIEAIEDKETKEYKEAKETSSKNTMHPAETKESESKDPTTKNIEPNQKAEEILLQEPRIPKEPILPDTLNEEPIEPILEELEPSEKDAAEIAEEDFLDDFSDLTEDSQEELAELIERLSGVVINEEESGETIAEAMTAATELLTEESHTKENHPEEESTKEKIIPNQVSENNNLETERIGVQLPEEKKTEKEEKPIKEQKTEEDKSTKEENSTKEELTEEMRRAKAEEEKKKALEAARVAAAQLMQSRSQQNWGRPLKR